MRLRGIGALLELAGVTEQLFADTLVVSLGGEAAAMRSLATMLDGFRHDAVPRAHRQIRERGRRFVL